MGAPAYVGALDGLRAVAVAAVIVYHFSPSTLPAGFLGVDVFFVVSGFLIARLLVGEAAHQRAVSLATFWGRRARRLLPTLATVTAVVCVAVAISFSTTELHDLRGQALGTLFYVANWVLIAQKGNYFATVGRPSPLLHMWSLAIEEQFYLVLPLVVFAARRAIVRRPGRAAAIAILGAMASTVWMAVLVSPGDDPSRAYLGTGSHAMGLLVGVALGILAGTEAPWEALGARLGARSWLGRAAPIAGLLVFAGILVTMRVANDHTIGLYRGGFLWFSLACAVVLIVVVLCPGAAIARMLAPWLVAVGLRSYSLYLWHWPVRVFVTPRPGMTGLTLFMVRLAISVVLAEISFRLIERPFRLGKIARRTGSRGAILYYAGLTLVVIVLVFTVAAPGSLPSSSLESGETPAAPNALRVDLFGDSTALVFGLSGREHTRELGISVGGAAQLGCGVVLQDHESDGRIIPNPVKQCDGLPDRWTASLRRDPNAVLALMTGAWDILDQRGPDGLVRFGTSAWTDLVTSSLRDTLSRLTATGRTVYLFEVPCYGAGDPAFPLPERQDPDRIAALNDIYEMVAAETPGVEIVHWRDLVCPNGTHADEIDGKPLWEPDNVHLTDAGALAVWKWWLPQIARHKTS